VRPLGAIAKRELVSLIATPTGWVAAALFAALTAVSFALGSLNPGEPASLRAFFASSHWLLLVVAPALSMRLLAEERRSGTLDVLTVAPIADWSIAAGKHLGALAFLLIMLAPTLVYPAILLAVSDPEPGPILAGYLGLILVGSVYLAVGLLMSALTDSQVVAFLTTFFFFLVLWFATSTLPAILGANAAPILAELSIGLRIADFAKGVIDTRHIAFFLIASGWFIAMTAITLQARRWR